MGILSNILVLENIPYLCYKKDGDFMKKWVFLSLLLLVGCSSKEIVEVEKKPKKEIKIELVEKLDFEFASNIKLKDLVINHNTELLNEDELLDTSSLGKKSINLKYKDSNETKNMNIEYNIVDTTEPVLNLSNMTTYVGKEVNFLNNMMCGDNYDREVKCEIIGEYDINKVGTYMLSVKATDSSNNTNEKNFKLTVKEKNSSSGSSKPN